MKKGSPSTYTGVYEEKSLSDRQTNAMPRLEMMLLVLLILPLPYFNAADGQAIQGDGQSDGMDRYLLRGDRDVNRPCHADNPGSPWGRCCRTVMCGSRCCDHSYCRCVYESEGIACACTS